MSEWHIDPTGARAVADATAAAAEALGDQSPTGDGRHFTEASFLAMGDNLNQGEVLLQSAVAVQQLLSDQQANLTNIMQAISAATVGVRSVVGLYEYAGLAMSDAMSAAQAEALAAAESGDFSYFTGGGE